MAAARRWPALAAHGVGKGDRVLVHSRNSFEFVETLFATLRLGAVWVPTNFRIAPDEAAYLAQASGAKVFLCQGDYADHAEAVARAMPQLALLARLGPEGFAAPEVADLIEAQRGAAPACVDVEHDDPCWFFFVRHHRAAESGGADAWADGLRDHQSSVRSHAGHDRAGRQPGRGAAVARRRHPSADPGGARRTVLPASTRFDAEEIWQLVERHRVSNMFTVPTIVKMLVEHPAVDAWDHSSLRYVIYAGAPMYREDQKRALEKLGPVLVQYFGLGEVTGNITVLPPALHEAADAPGARLGTAASSAPACRSASRTTAAGSWTRPAGRDLRLRSGGVRGLLRQSAGQRKAFRDGWFRTGDLGYMDAEGFVYITGRQSDMYISGGSNIYPREVEERC